VETKDFENNLSYVSINIYDSRRWENIDIKLRDLLVKKSLIRESDIKFSNNETSSVRAHSRIVPLA